MPKHASRCCFRCHELIAPASSNRHGDGQSHTLSVSWPTTSDHLCLVHATRSLSRHRRLTRSNATNKEQREQGQRQRQRHRHRRQACVQSKKPMCVSIFMCALPHVADQAGFCSDFRKGGEGKGPRTERGRRRPDGCGSAWTASGNGFWPLSQVGSCRKHGEKIRKSSDVDGKATQRYDGARVKTRQNRGSDGKDEPYSERSTML